MQDKDISQEKSALTLVDIVKTYGTDDFEVKALNGVSINFRKNEFVSILGPSGCGKTTMLNIIGGLDRYTSGDLIIDGKSTKNYKDKDWDAYRNNCIGFVFQSYNLIPHQTVLANVELALELSGIAKKERKQRALAMLERVGLKGQERKKPNQLSGGQMQRVAIARALVNDPEIILADEPTGALDTETSIQIMDLLKEVAKDRLVIMVTHNPDLARKYSTRIIKFLDGIMIDDSNPFKLIEEDKPKTRRKPKMGLKTAFLLSLKNLISKRARTILTSIAGSIGIIGVALVLALSNGFSIYMSRMQTDTLSSYPLTISESSVDFSSATEFMNNSADDLVSKTLENVKIKTAFEKLTNMLQNNKLSDTSENGFLAYLNNVDKDTYYSISYDYGFDMNDYFFTDITLNGHETFTSIDNIVTSIEKAFEAQLQSAMGLNTSFVRQYIPTITEMPDRALVTEQYDVLYGEIPEFNSENANKMVLVVDENNSVSDITLMLLGYISGSFNATNNTFEFEEKESLPLEDVLGKGFYLAKNEDKYSTDGTYFYISNPTKESLESEKLEIVGVLREKSNADGILKTGLAYSKALTEKVIAQNKDSAISIKAKENEQAKILTSSGNSVTVYLSNLLPKTNEYVAEELTARKLASVSTPSEIKIYAKDFDSKETIKQYIDAWNDRFEEGDENIITYSDTVSMLFGMLNTMVKAVTYVLVAFTSISLVVSSVMIGIITYISVVERTKEIGVLRSLGASKGEISNVFNAETFLIGMFAGLIGVGVTYLLSIPINLLINMAVEGIGNIAILNPFTALILVVISITLTLISGLIPSRIASKKDPVIALRTE